VPKNRSAGPPPRAGRSPLALDRATTTRLLAIGHAAGGDLDAVLLAALAILVGRATGAELITAGGPGRTHRISLACDPALREVVAAIAADRGGGDGGDHDVFLVTRARGAPGRVRWNQPGGAPGLIARATAAGLRGELVHGSTLPGAEHVAEHLAERLHTLLHAIAGAPTAPIGALAIVGPRERQRLAALEGKIVRGRARWLHAGFIARANRTPDAIAIEEGDRRLSYGELRARVYRLARHLREAGIGDHARVAIALDRSIELVVAVLAVLVAGAAVVPLDIEDPAERRAVILEDADATAVITSGRHRDALGAAGAAVRVIDLERAAAAIAARSARPLPVLAGGDRLAFVFYTTGSTGRPKGVMISHHARAERLAWEVAAKQHPPELQLLHALTQIDHGGENEFVDAPHIITKLDPADLQLLRDIPVDFVARSETVHFRGRHPILTFDRQDRFVGVHYNEYKIELPPETPNAYYGAFRRFQALIKRPENVCVILLPQDSMVLLHNRRTLHGRRAFGPGPRHYEGCFLSDDDLRSTYRTLVRDRAGRGSPAAPDLRG
jgi:hypothetical protein